VADKAPDRVQGWDIDEMCRWSARVPELVDGDRLLHTDLHPYQFLVTDDRVYVIDWALPAAGAAWVDSAFMALRLFAAGHPPDEAWRWARERSSWKPDTDALAAWSVYVAWQWSWFAVNSHAKSGMHRRAEIARDYAAWCLNSVTGRGTQARAAVTT
jgi:thiamine kinase-like enzyme